MFVYTNYSPSSEMGLVSMDIYLREDLRHSIDFRIEGKNSGELKILGIKKCLEYATEHAILHFVVYSDCKSEHPLVRFVVDDDNSAVMQNFKKVVVRSFVCLGQLV